MEINDELDIQVSSNDMSTLLDPKKRTTPQSEPSRIVQNNEQLMKVHLTSDANLNPSPTAPMQNVVVNPHQFQTLPQFQQQQVQQQVQPQVPYHHMHHNPYMLQNINPTQSIQNEMMIQKNMLMKILSNQEKINEKLDILEEENLKLARMCREQLTMTGNQETLLGTVLADSSLRQWRITSEPFVLDIENTSFIFG